MNKTSTSTTRKRRPVIIIGLLVISIFSVVVIRHLSENVSIAIATLPVIAALWYFGYLGGILTFFTLFIFDLVASLWIKPVAGIESILNINYFVGLVIVALIVAVFGGLIKIVNKQREELSIKDSIDKEKDKYTLFLSLLSETVQASLEAEDMASMLKILTVKMGKIFEADDCMVAHRNGAWHWQTPLVTNGIMQNFYKDLPINLDEHALISSVLKNNHPLFIEDVRQTTYLEAKTAARLPICSLLVLPLITIGQERGVVILGFSKPRHYSEEDIAHSEVVARKISLAMTKVQLLEDARHRVRELAGLHMLSEAFTLRGDDHQTYGLLTDILAGLMNASMCIISLFDPTTHDLRAQIPAHGLADDLIEAFNFPLEMGLHAWKFAEGGVFRANKEEELPKEFIPTARALGIETVLASPLWDVDRRLMGAIYVANKRGGFDNEDINLIEIYASQVAIVIQNTRLLLSERRRTGELEVLHAISVATTEADDEDELIELATELIGKQLYPHSFEIMLLDESMVELYLRSAYRRNEPATLIRVPLGVGIIGSVAKSGKPKRVDNFSTVPKYLSVNPLTQSELCVPLKVNGRVIGVVNVESAHANVFTNHDEELIDIVVNQIATAIQRLRSASAERYHAEQLARSNAMIKALAQVSTRAAAAVDPDSVMRTLGAELAKLSLTCMVALSETNNDYVTIRYTSLPPSFVRILENLGKQKIYEYRIPIDRLGPVSTQIYGVSIIADPIIAVKNIVPDFNEQTLKKLVSSIGMTENIRVCYLPLIVEGKTVGIMWMWGEGLREADLPTLSLFASQVAATLRSTNLLAEVQRLAITDELTSINNRRHFFELAEKEFKRAQRYQHPLSALIADIDHFKQFNDNYGHLVGDQVLHAVAQLFQENVRKIDILGRYGGEEFSILLPMTNLRAAVRTAERLHAQISGSPIQTSVGVLSVELSIGVSRLTKKTQTLLALINQADQAMYEAKRAGRNRVASN